MTERFHPRLKKGEVVEYDGRLHTVIRVTPGAAYLALGDWRTEMGVLPRDWNELTSISVRSAVRRLE